MRYGEYVVEDVFDDAGVDVVVVADGILAVGDEGECGAGMKTERGVVDDEALVVKVIQMTT